MTTSYVSKEEFKHISTLSTHDALIELGKQLEITNREKRNRNNRIIELEYLINNYNFKTINISQKLPNSWNMTLKNFYEEENINKYISIVLEYIKMINEDKIFKNNEIQNLKNDIIELENESRESHKEYDDLDKKFQEREKYWTNQVIKLKEKCMYKNKVSKAISYIFTYSISQSLLINYIGFYNYSNAIYFSLYYFISLIYQTTYYIYLIIYYIINHSFNVITYIYFNILNNFLLVISSICIIISIIITKRIFKF